MFFVPVLEFDVPTRAEDLTRRDHNRYVKEAARDVLATYHKKFTRRKFQADASRRYGYAPRSAKYNRRKQRLKGHRIPMLYSGRSRDTIAGSPPKIRIGGAAEGGKKGITASLFLRFPFAGGTGQGANNRVIRQLIRELGRWADDEVRWAVPYFRDRYMEKVNNHRSRRKRLRMPRR